MRYLFSFREYRLRLRTPLRTAHGTWREREGLLVRLEDEAGRGGFGEIAPVPWFGTETMSGAGEICRGLGDQIGPEELARVPERFGCVRFALSCALRPGPEPASAEPPAGTGAKPCSDRDMVLHAPDEARGMSAGGARQPVAARLRIAARLPVAAREPIATRESIATRLPVAAVLPAGRAALRELPDRLEAGFLAFKWKVGVERPADELGVLDDLLGAMPAGAKLRLDANGAWDRRTAVKWLKRCAERPVEFIEQPVAPADEDTLLGLARDYPVTLALDESVVRLAEARRWQGLGWPGVFVIKPALCGPLVEIEAWAHETKADVVLSSAVETAVGRAAILPWARRSGVTKRALGFGVGEVFADGRWNGPALGALADAGVAQSVNLEELWTAL